MKRNAFDKYENYKEHKVEEAQPVHHSEIDESETKLITVFEENCLHLRHVKLEDYENRLKMLVTPEKGKASVVKLKQLKEAFKGNHYLTKILEKGQNG